MLRNLQIWHLLWLALIPILFGLFRLSSEPYDSDRVLVDNLFVLVSAAWLGIVAVYFALTGKKDEALQGLLGLYRRLLNKVWFLWISNVIGTVLLVFIGYKLTFFRQVEFLSVTDVELHLNDSPGQDIFVGLIKAKTPLSFRLPIGTRMLVFREVGSDKPIASSILVVPSLVHQPGRVRHLIYLTEDRPYEKTH